jgi:hypothetical protein
MFSDSLGEGFFDGPGMQAAKGPLIGGGLTQLGIIAVNKFAPAYKKYAGLIGMVIGGGASAYLMSKPEHREAGAAGLATALIVGLPRQLNELMGGTLMGADEISSDEMAGLDAYTMEGPAGMQLVGIEDSGSGSTGMGAYTMEGPADSGMSIQGGDFGATGF